MKYKTLHAEARQIDQLIDLYMHSSRTSVIPQEELKKLILKNFADLYVANFGGTKLSSAFVQWTIK